MRIAIGDIHGCNKTFLQLIHQIGLTDKDDLYLLGDYINKGPASKEILDTIMHLQEQRYRVFPVRGNHDQKLIDVRKGNLAGKWLIDTQLSITLASFRAASPFDIPEKYVAWLDSLPYYIDTGDYYLVHAGFNLLISDIFQDKGAMINSKKFDTAGQRINGRRIVHGHIPTPIDSIRMRIQARNAVLPLDGGCVYYKTSEMGKLLAFDLDKNLLFEQENTDQPYEGGRYR